MTPAVRPRRHIDRLDGFTHQIEHHQMAIGIGDLAPNPSNPAVVYLVPADGGIRDRAAPGARAWQSVPMSENFRDLPEPEDMPLAGDDLGGDLIGDDAADVLAGAEDGLLETESEVTTEDLSVDDLLNNGALPEDLELDDQARTLATNDAITPGRTETIDDRLRQEEPEPGSGVVPPTPRNTDPNVG